MENYKKWEPLKSIPSPLYLVGIYDDVEGFRVLLGSADNTGKVLRITFDPPIGYRNFNESYLLKKWEKESGWEGGSSLYTVENSEFILWLNDNSHNIYVDEKIVHYAIYTQEDCVDVLSTSPPKVEWLFPKS